MPRRTFIFLSCFSFLVSLRKSSACTWISKYLIVPDAASWFYLSDLRLNRIFPSISTVCAKYKSVKGTLTHLFWGCSKVKTFWEEIFYLIWPRLCTRCFWSFWKPRKTAIWDPAGFNVLCLKVFLEKRNLIFLRSGSMIRLPVVIWTRWGALYLTHTVNLFRFGVPLLIWSEQPV